MMAIKITQPGAFGCDTKRFYMPGALIETECPKCSKPVEFDYETNYVSYPGFNQSFDETILCDECQHEWPVKVQINLSLELVEP